MKRWLRILCLVLALVCIGTVLAGCAKTLNGTYKADVPIRRCRDICPLLITAVLVLGAVVTTLSGTYEIGDGTITLTFGDAEEAEAKTYGGTFEFVEMENSIKIGMMELTRVEG